MRILNNIFNRNEGKTKVPELTSVLPWSYYIKREADTGGVIKLEECIVIHKDGCIQQTFGFRGNDLESYSANYINSVYVYLNEAIKRLGDGWMVSVEAQRYSTRDYPESDFNVLAGYLVEQERKRGFQKFGEHYDSLYYMTFVFKPEGELKEKAVKMFFTNIEYEKRQEDLIENFVKETTRLTNVLQNKLLIRPLTCWETVQYLHSTVSLNKINMVLPDHFLFLDTFITDMSFSTGITSKLGDYYIPILCINDFPMETYPTILHHLNKCYIEYRWVSRFFPLEKEEAMKELDKWQGKHQGARKNAKQLMAEVALNVELQKENVGAGELKRDTEEAMKEVMTDVVGLGYYNSCVMVWDKDYERAMNKMMEIRKIIESCGFTCKEETHNSQQAFLGMVAGDVYRNIRRPLVMSANYAHVLPLSAVWGGMIQNKFTNEICGIDKPLVTCSTDSGTPFFLNLNDGDVGHTLVFGPTGAGKSTLLGLLSISYLKYPFANVFIIDKGASALTMTLAVGGEYVDPAAIEECFQPLGDLETESDRTWAVDFIETLLEVQGVNVKPQLLIRIRTTIEHMSQMEKAKRTLTTFRQTCLYKDDITGEKTIDEALHPYTLEGPYGHIFDGEETKINDSRWVLFEMSELMEYKDKVVAPALMFLFHWLEKRFRGQMTLLIVDEAWRFLDHEVFRKRMRQWLKELRKKHVFCVFATQEVADAAKSEIVSTLIQNCPTKIYLADPESFNNADSYERFGLTSDEINLLSLSRKKKDYYFKSTMGTRLFRIDAGPIFLGLMRQQDDIITDEEGDKIRWGDYCKYLLEKRAKGEGRGFAQEILDMQGKKYKHYLSNVAVDKVVYK